MTDGESTAQPGRHYTVSLYDSEKYGRKPPAIAVADAGFTYKFFHPRPISDSCLFYFVDGPEIVPDWMTPCQIPGYMMAVVLEAIAEKG